MREREREREKVRERDGERDREGDGERDRRGARESDGEWIRVVSKKDRRWERGSKDPRRSFAGTKPVQQLNHTRTTWRESSDVSTFYFTRFPEDATERDLWLHFKKWGDVRELFISKKRNKMGRRYGFVRFKGVSDV